MPRWARRAGRRLESRMGWSGFRLGLRMSRTLSRILIRHSRPSEGSGQSHPCLRAILPCMSARRFGVCLLAVVSSLSSVGLARVTRVEIASRRDVLEGKTFGEAGIYERIVGRVYFSIPVANPHNQRIVDLALAENLKNGEVEFSADFVAVRPKDARKGSGSMLLEVPNRGHSRILSLVDGGDEDLSKDAGDAWFLRNGFTVVSLGWQWDADGADAQKLYAPVAKETGKTITGLLRGDFMLPKVMEDVPLGHYFVGRIGGVEYPISAPNDSRNVLTVRDTREGRRITIPRSQW